MSLTLEQLIEKLQTIDAIGVAIVRDAVPAAQEWIQDSIRARTDPYGKAWKKSKSGAAILTGAAGASSAIVSGVTQATLALRLLGFYIFHHYGTKKDPARPMLPTKSGGVPAPLLEILKASTRRVLGQVLS